MKQLAFVCLLFLFPVFLFCQTPSPMLDSLKRTLPANTSAKQQAERLQAILRYIFFSAEFVFGNFPKQLDSLHQCCIARKTGDERFEKMVEADVSFYKGAAILYEQPAGAKPFFQSALRQYEVLGDSAKLAMVYMGRCIAASGEGDSLAFAGAYDQALRLAPSIREPYELGNLYNSLGMSCYDFGRFAESIQLDFDILKLIDNNPTPEMLEGKPSIYYNIGAVYGRLGDNANARLYTQMSVNEAQATKQDPSDYLTGLAWQLTVDKDYQKALEIYQSILKTHPVPTTLTQIAASTYGMATCYRNLGDLKQALPLAKKGVELLPVHLHASYGSAALRELAFCEYKLGMIDSALEHALLAFQTFSNANNNGGSVEAAELLTKIYKQKSDYRKAFEYSELRYKFQNLIERQQSSRQLAFNEFTRENEVKTAHREAEVQAQLTRQRNIRYALFAGLAVLALLAFLLYNRYRFKQRSAAQLEAKNREVEAARRRAEKSEAFKSRFLANMSHEIRTPLHGIAGFTGLLLDTSLSEKQRRWLSSMQHSTERLTEVVNDILDLSKLEAGEVQLRQVPFSPAQIAADVREALSLRAENKGIELKLRIGENVSAAVLGDPTRLYQILMNLAGNAVKFTEKGSVTMEIEQLEIGKLTDGQPPNAPISNFQFLISDTGIGIPPEHLKTIFDSFRQAGEDTTARFGGTGLGLTIARELVQLHGSDIRVESEINRGSKFSFMLSFPLANAADLENKTAVSEHLFFNQPLRILLADDNAFNREIAAEALLRHFENVEIAEATTGKEAVELLNISGEKGRGNFDLILMDMQMPEMTGTEATQHIRQHFSGKKQHIPILALTASATPEEIEKALQSGMNRHLGKPFKPHELAQAVAEMLHLQPAPQASEQDFSKPHTADADAQSSPFDLRFLRDFCNGDEAQVQHFLKKFSLQCPLEINKLEDALARHDPVGVFQAAHSFKPQLEFVGLREAVRLVAEMERSARSGPNFEELGGLLEQLKLSTSP